MHFDLFIFIKCKIIKKGYTMKEVVIVDAKQSFRSVMGNFGGSLKN